MLIRTGQLESVQQVIFDNFADDCASDSGSRISAAQPPLSRSDARVLCEFMWKGASQHGFESLAALACLVDLSYLFGPRLLADPTLPWVATVLADKTVDRDIVKADTLFAHARRRLHEWYGPGTIQRLAVLTHLVDRYRSKALTETAFPRLIPAKAVEAGAPALARFRQHSDAAAVRGARIAPSLRYAIDFVMGVAWLEHPVGWTLTGGAEHQPTDMEVVAAIDALTR